ncbi:MAG: T9SS type A sorting domain-containing protein, partial [Opitutaceae bacterium]|nr:T9SS type A sorting domain-containing protein [Cytophagales bacterium]
FNQTDGMRVTHRAWGMDNVYIIQTGKKTQLTASIPISISFDFKNDISMPVNDFEIGFATGESSSGPILSQSLVPLSAGSINATFSTKTISITPTATSDLYLTIRLKWGSQLCMQSNTVFRNIAVCPVVNARLSNDFPVDDMSGNSSSFNLVVAPNPSENNFNISISSSKDLLKIKATNLIGEIVYENEEYNGGNSLDIGGDWPQGVYILQVQNGEKVINSKLKKF